MPTDDQRAFWAAIRANPADDTARLVYADWLQENGDEPRAAFIRLQCQIAALPDDHQTRRKVLPGLRHQERVLLTANRVRWGEPLFRALARPGPGVNPEAWCRTLDFERGFVAKMRLDLDGAHRVMTARDQIEPLQDLHVFQTSMQYNTKKLAELFRWDGVGCIDRFVLIDATDNCVGSIVSGAAARPAHLGFAGGAVTDAGATFLAKWAGGKHLGTLDLGFNRIGDAGAEALAAAPHLICLGWLNLEGNPIGRDARRRLVARYGGDVHFGE